MPKPPEKALLSKVFSPFTVKYPQLLVDVNRDQVHSMQLNLSDVYGTLQTYLGSLYVNDFNQFGRTWQVVVQADERFRNNIEAVRRLKVRNARGGMAPLGGIADIREINGPLVVTRYNMYPAASVQGDSPQGVSSGQSIEALQKLVRENLPKAMTTEWTEITYLQLLAENTGMIIFGFAVLLVFLVLAAQYESWSLPLGGDPGGADVHFKRDRRRLFRSVGYQHFHADRFRGAGGSGMQERGADRRVRKAQAQTGLSRREATLEACRLRLRPILMTSFAFILGVAPLVLAIGAGAEMRRALGVAVFSGMLGVTLFGIFLTPVFFYVIDWLSHSWLFSSLGMHQFGNMLLDVFTFRYPRRMLLRNGPWCSRAGDRGTRALGDDRRPAAGKARCSGYCREANVAEPKCDPEQTSDSDRPAGGESTAGEYAANCPRTPSRRRRSRSSAFRWFTSPSSITRMSSRR